MPQSSKVIPAQDDSYLDSDLDKEAQSPRLTEDGESDSVWGKIKSIPIIADLVLIWSVMSYDCLKDTTRYLLDTYQIKINISFEDALMAMTLFVLFAQDIMVMAVQMSSAAESGVETMNSICMFFFIFELLLNTWSKSTFNSFYPKFTYDGYFLTFYWWLDLIAIVSMWFDISWIAEPIGVGGISSSVSGASNLAKAGRVVRLVRLVRLVKLFKIASERRKRVRQEQDLMELVQIGAITFQDLEKQRALNNERKSKLGGELSESTTKRVIVIVLVMVCVLPLLTSITTNNGPDYALKLIMAFQMNNKVSAKALSDMFDQLSADLHTRNGENYLIKLSSYVGNKLKFSVLDSDKYGNIRESATVYEDLHSSNGTTSFHTSAVFSLRPLEYDLAKFSVVTTFFIGFLLVVGSVVFVGDTERLVLKPIGRMMNMVEEVAKDPLAPLNIGDNGGEYETRLLETTIEKITGLLRVGFGEAGAGIISANLSSENGTSSINPLLPGVRVYAIVGFCDIHKFEFVNQNLSSDILRFVNTIAEIVHSRVHYWGGQCNKNLGNAFVIIWRIGDEETLRRQITGFGKKADDGVAQMAHLVSVVTTSHDSPSPNRTSRKGILVGMATPSGKNKTNVLDLRRVPGVDELANKALIGYLKIIVEINRNPAVLAYRTEPRLTLYGAQEFSVTMGFGLHAGWAIEGAVGSVQKVDATYLSPHVNMAARLETSSRQYGVPILISHFTHELFSPEVQQYCRRVDVCTVKGSNVPISVYTYDCLQNQQFLMKGPREKNEKWCPEDGLLIVSKKKSNRRSETSVAIESVSTKSEAPQEPLIYFGKSDEDASEVFDNDADLTMLRNHVTDEFLTVFAEGVTSYINGEWPNAKKLLEQANSMMAKLAPSLGGDGPCLTLLEYMNEHECKAPADWRGYRPLTSK